MANDLHQAFYGVFCSSKEIIKNKQRHLYVNMLDLLGRTCKATGLAENVIGADNLVKFWLEDILPLVFDTDRAIQSCAVNTIEQGMSLLKVNIIHSSKHWPELRNNMVTTLPSKIHELRSNKNKHWHQIWCLIIKILDREILNGASIINSFLSTVELGFRSSDSSVRAETFLCWKLLIKIFHSYNELLTPKRLKLICIPLKSTQSKSPSLANIKIRVWWYFITCIGDNLNENFSKIVEPFLTYVFGASNREDRSGDLQQYESIQILAVLCLAQLLADDQDDFIDILITENELDTLIRPSPILQIDTFKENWKQISHAIIYAVKLFSNIDDDSENRDAKQHLRNWLLMRLVKIMLHLNLSPFTHEVCQHLISFLPAQTLPISTALNCLANDGFNIDPTTFDANNFSDNLNELICLIIVGKNFITSGVLQRCIEQISKLSQKYEREEFQQQAMLSTIKVICKLKDDDDFDAFETRLLCWKRIAQTIINHLSDKILSYRRKDIAEMFNEFILWPLRQFDSFAGSCITNSFDEDFCAFWRQLLLCGQNDLERMNFLNSIQRTLRDLMKSGKCELPLPELVNAYVAAVLKCDSGKDAKNINEILAFLRDVIDQPKIVETKAFEIYLNTIRNVYSHMKNSELIEHFEIVKCSIAHVVGIVGKTKPNNMKIFNDWKQGIFERFRILTQKNYLTQIKEIFKNDDVFVIIPNVWILNPEKLTERQKERFAERSDIPALYNDMSQSQDSSSIKPWTPSKVVLAKKDQTEIIIGQIDDDDDDDAGEGKSDGMKNMKTSGNPTAEIRSTRRRSIKLVDGQNESDGKSKNTKSSINDKNNETDEIKDGTKEITETNTDTAIMRQTRKSLRSSKADDAKNSKSEDAEPKEQQKITRSAEARSPTKAKQIESIVGEKVSYPIESVEEEKTEKSETPLLRTRKGLASQETQLNTETLTMTAENISPSDEIIPETPLMSATPVQNVREAELTIRSESIEINLEPKEISPKKSTTKIHGLSSPPDRKSTNNSCSPSLRPKPTPHLTRGAQFISMIRSKMKSDSPASSSSPVSFASSRSSIHLSKFDRRESTPVPETESTPFDHTSTSTPVQKRDFLTFSKRLPSPSASPSASILKRKLRRESIDDISADSPATKRKRVSFHDPPVSLTKEYVRDVEENLMKPKRCLSMDKVNAAQAAELKHALKRRSKLDSMVEIETFSNETIEKHINTPPSTSSSARKMSLTFDEPNDDETEKLSMEPSPSNLTVKEPAPIIESVPDVDTALKVIIENCSLETVLERYFTVEKTASVKLTDTLAKFVSNCMTTNAKLKSSVLEILSENHSKDFLDHAVQENLSSVVCDRLNLDSVIEYICAKSKLNASCRNNLLAKIPDILKHSKVEKEPLNFIGKLVESMNPTDAIILDLIANLMHIRHERQSSSTPDMDSTDVSSSNL